MHEQLYNYYTFHSWLAIFFLQKAFSAVQELWGQKLPKEYGPHMAESMLAILYHIIKGEAVIKDKLGPAPESTSSTSGSSTAAAAARPPDEPARAQPEINMRHLQQVSHGCIHFIGLLI